MAVLARDHDELCTQAADHSEIAAGLEAAGVSDRQARRTYGFASVFELAEAMYHTVPRRPVDSRTRPDPWRRPVARHLLRGLLYALPGADSEATSDVWQVPTDGGGEPSVFIPLAMSPAVVRR